jgi:arginine/ornithine transport system ATP-binding protein
MAQSSLHVDDLHKRFGDREVLRGLSLAVQPGEVATLIGASGSGKSTFLRCLNLLEQPHAGTLRVGDETLALVRDRDGSLRAGDAKQLQRWRVRLAMVFQNFNLWAHRTALENVVEVPIHVLGRSKAEATDRARQLLARVGLSHRENVYPAHLSGGEQQRVAIARAVANAPRVLFADEPTGNLDPGTADHVFNALMQLVKATRVGMLIATHNMELAGRMDRRVSLEAGKVIELE